MVDDLISVLLLLTYYILGHKSLLELLLYRIRSLQINRTLISLQLITPKLTLMCVSPAQGGERSRADGVAHHSGGRTSSGARQTEGPEKAGHRAPEGRVGGGAASREEETPGGEGGETELSETGGD